MQEVSHRVVIGSWCIIVHSVNKATAAAPILFPPFVSFSLLLSPFLTFSHLLSPLLFSPFLSFSILFSPFLTFSLLLSPFLTFSHLFSPSVTFSNLFSLFLTFSHLTSPHLTSPHLSSPLQSSSAALTLSRLSSTDVTTTARSAVLFPFFVNFLPRRLYLFIYICRGDKLKYHAVQDLRGPDQLSWAVTRSRTIATTSAYWSRALITFNIRNDSLACHISSHLISYHLTSTECVEVLPYLLFDLVLNLTLLVMSPWQRMPF